MNDADREIVERLHKRVELAGKSLKYIYESDRFDGLDSSTPGYDAELDLRTIDLIESQAAELTRLREMEHRFRTMMPLFQDARDAITALSMNQCKLHRISLDLAERMDDVGIIERWNALQATAAKGGRDA